jgi:hypothetical protein
MQTESNETEKAEKNSSSLSTSMTHEYTTPNYLIPAMGDISFSEPAYYRSLYILNTFDQESPGLIELDGPIDPFKNKDLLGQTNIKPAVGVLTVHQQSWYQKGIALGNLLQSVCLAPGEVTQVAVTRWEHKTLGTSSEYTEQQESVSDRIEQNRAVNEVQRAIAHETQMGKSSVSSHSASAQAGGAWFFASASAASTTSNSLTAQFSAGTRNLAAESTNMIAQRTAEESQSLRSRRQSVVREVSEQEAESLSTRVLANYNRRHAMNILFFEVLQTYDVKTELSSWERCLFVPMIPLDFATQGVIEDHKAQLLNIFIELDAKELIETLNETFREENMEDKVFENKVNAITKEIKKLENDKTYLQDFKSNFDADYSEMDDNQKKEKLNEVRMDKQYLRLLSLYNLPQKDDVDLMNPQYDSLTPLISDAKKKLEIAKAQKRIPVAERFNLFRLFLSQQLWLRLSSYEYYCILKGYKIKDQSLSDFVDPKPVGVFGNYLAFRWGFSDTDSGQKEHTDFYNKYIKKAEEANSHTVGLPTSGVFSEAVLGRGLAAEMIDERFYKWGDEQNRIPILPPKIADLQSRDRAKGMNLTAQDFATSLAQLRGEKLSEVSYIDKVLGQAGKSDTFRDMGGLAQAVTLAEKLASLSSEGATKAGENAVKLQAKVLETFEKVIDSDVGKAAVAEFMLPGSGATLLSAGSQNKLPTPETKKPSSETKKPSSEPKQ